MAWLFHSKRGGVSDWSLASQMVADYLRDPQRMPLPDPPIQGLTMADPKDSDDEFEFDDDELDAEGNYIGSESVRLQQEAADDE